MGLARVMRAAKPLIASVSRSSAGRAALLTPLKARPWSTSPEEAIGVREGFAESGDFGRTVLWALMLDGPPRSGPCRLPGHLVQGMADWVTCGQTVRYLPFIPGSRFSPLLMAGHARSRTGRRRSPPGGGDGGAGGRPDRNPARRPPSPSPRRLLGVEVGAAEPGARHRLDEARLPRGVGRRQRREQLAWVIPSANQ
jgi:hypothetical protein